MSYETFAAEVRAEDATYTDEELKAAWAEANSSSDDGFSSFAAEVRAEDATYTDEELKAAWAEASEPPSAGSPIAGPRDTGLQMAPGIPDPTVPQRPSLKSGSLQDVPYEKLTNERVYALAKEFEIDPHTQDGIDAIYSINERRKEGRQTKEHTLRQLQEYANIERPIQYVHGVFSEAAEKDYQDMLQSSRQRILDMAHDRQITAEYVDGKLMYKDAQGKWQPLTSNTLEELGLSKGEMVGAMSGAAAGWNAPVPLWWKPLTALGGGMAGAAVGETVDYLGAMIDLDAKFEARLLAEKAAGAAVTDGLFALGGGAVMKAIAKTGVGGYNLLQHAIGWAKNHNMSKAREALREQQGLTEEQIDETIALFEKHFGTIEGKTRDEKALMVVPQTKSAGEAAISSANDIIANRQPSLTVRENLNNVSKAFIEQTKGPQVVAKELGDSLADYERAVKSLYADVRERGAAIVPKDYSFNIQKPTSPIVMAQGVGDIKRTKQELQAAPGEDILSLLQKAVDDIVVSKDKELLYNQRERLANKLEARSFDELIELRQDLGEIAFGSASEKGSAKRAADKVAKLQKKVDEEIERVANLTPEGKAWYEEWQGALAQYTQYAEARKTRLFKFVQAATQKPKKGKKPAAASSADEARVIKELLAERKGINGNYEVVMSKVPPSVRANVEEKMIGALVEKHTMARADFSAINFPALAKSLKGPPMKSPRAAAIVETANDFAELWRNNKYLFKGPVKVATNPEGNISTSPVGKLKMWLATNFFTRMMDAAGGVKSDMRAMAFHINNALAKPLDKEAVNGLMARIDQDAEFIQKFGELQRTAAEEVAAGRAPKTLKVFDDKGKVVEEVAEHRVLNDTGIELLTGVRVDSLDDLDSLAKIKLVEAGYLMIRKQNGDLIDLRKK